MEKAASRTLSLRRYQIGIEKRGNYDEENTDDKIRGGDAVVPDGYYEHGLPRYSDSKCTDEQR